ncbi:MULTISPECIES: alpha/beta hydrolase fold domain-containing protein [unclassified Chelatococcus]|uniref:alpha/beta hydrolase n=1 Tax=unclassified Chelatococcus TaxID=2638111 RepID=UPI001BCFBAC5|nr:MULTISPECIES: alpha/beta hydrolase fold domain-containing protein [unclassified Chelatococcus]MBS7700386.1 alpha/beta hydrolase fold domain-containing protein [Chelatococcus sp. YT9]MBX3556182.1 alpha/beta hydrolase fold domain-containing protein [Chelatococcus sp.]
MFDNAMQIYKEMIRDADGGSAGKSRHPETRRRQCKAMADVFKKARPPQLADVDSFIAAQARETPIPVYPPDGDSPMSTLVYMNGGGYRPESPSCHDTGVANLAAAAGVHVFAVHYRRPSENPCPAAIDNGYPPAIIHIAELDPLFDEGMIYHERLRDAGCLSTLLVADKLLRSPLRAVPASAEARAAADALYGTIRRTLG